MDWDDEKLVRKTFGLGMVLTVKNLGVIFSCNQKVTSSQNVQENVLDKFQKVINIWNKRGLPVSLFGRVTIVKTLLITKFLYVSSIIQTPTETIKRMVRTRQGYAKFCYKLN